MAERNNALTEAERRAVWQLKRLVAAAENTLEMAEAGQYGAAYENLIRLEGMLIMSKSALAQSMTERRWRRG